MLTKKALDEELSWFLAQSSLLSNMQHKIMTPMEEKAKCICLSDMRTSSDHSHPSKSLFFLVQQCNLAPSSAILFCDVSLISYSKPEAELFRINLDMSQYEVIVLKDGYSSSVNGVQKACGTITLLKGIHNIIVDTGNPWDKDFILKRLLENGLESRDIHHVICSHGHSDHVGNLNLFPKAEFIVGYDVCHGDVYVDSPLSGGNFCDVHQVDACVQVRPCPGHSGQDVCVCVSDVQGLGQVIVAGDLFECAEDITSPDLWKDNSLNSELQARNRHEVLQVADHIVPGHGPMFKVTDEMRNSTLR